MYVLVLANGSARPLPGVAQIKHEDGMVLCLDHGGAVLERFQPQEVMVYGEDAKIASLLAEFKATPGFVQKRLADGSQQLCSAHECSLTAHVIFDFDSPIGGLKLGLCEAHQSLIDEKAQRIVLGSLDLRRLAITTATTARDF